MKVGMTIGGLDTSIARFQRSRSRIATNVENAILRIGEDILAESNTLVPVDTATLRNSGTVRLDKERSSGMVSVSVNYGVDVPIPRDYAMAVHERLDVQHRNGQAKFLETAFVNQLPDIPEKYKTYLLEDFEDE